LSAQGATLVYRSRGNRAGGDLATPKQALRTVGATLGAFMLVPAEEGAAATKVVQTYGGTRVGARTRRLAAIR
jgi:hypothetical protein